MRPSGLRLAVTTFTVLPLRAGPVDRGTAGRAMLWAPVMGALTGLVAAAVFAGAAQLGAGGLLAAVLAVGGTALFTRGLHLDGLADVADGLGSARPPAQALEIMKRSDIGPFGVAAMLFVVLIQVAAVAELAAPEAPAALSAGPLAALPVVPSALVIAYASSRLAITWACLRGMPAARPGGLGAMVAGTVRLPAALAATLLLAGVAFAAGGPALVAVALAAPAAAFPLLWHVLRRLGGVTGDVLGALAETGTVVTLVVAALVIP
ncbi:MAG: adenosylcobinamide-GDP ribazoletransferase [Streptosporangiales bacterium]|nr:adenosylcobinamide-GDP ribazoletransferase [Streptosporangiales bacterium]